MNGPPPSAAGPSQPRSNGHNIANIKQEEGPSSYTTVSTSGQSSFIQDYYATVTGQSTRHAVPAPPQPFYASNYVWPYPWTGPQYPSPSSIPQAQVAQSYYQSQRPPYLSAAAASSTPVPSPTTPPPTPPSPAFHPHWDAALKSFLVRVGLTQTLRGFELDMLVMNSDWERSEVPGALEDLVKNISKLDMMNDDGHASSSEQRPFDDRKLDYVQFVKGVETQSPTSLNRSISKFLAQNRARNDASNRAEFLDSPAQKKRRIDEGVAALTDELSSIKPPSCARTDAKPIDRDIQMKYDIAKNDDGPLRRTVKNTNLVGNGKDQDQENKLQPFVDLEKDGGELTSIRHPGLDERISNIETHLSIRYVPSPPRTLLDRLKFLEDHIVRLEKDYPPWAALHFNQPKRGWPPPPRSMPIIVPPSLRAAGGGGDGGKSSSVDSHPVDTARPSTTPTTIGKWRNNKSSLHRAVMEKLEVQKAMTDLAGDGS